MRRISLPFKHLLERPWVARKLHAYFRPGCAGSCFQSCESGVSRIRIWIVPGPENSGFGSNLEYWTNLLDPFVLSISLSRNKRNTFSELYLLETSGFSLVQYRYMLVRKKYK